jgi:hypothetical protein
MDDAYEMIERAEQNLMCLERKKGNKNVSFVKRDPPEV